jgi:hypothetical protein
MSNEFGNGPQPPWQRAFFLLLSILVGIWLSISGWTLVRVVALQGDIREIQSQIEAELIIGNDPPPWFSDYLDEKFKSIHDRLVLLERKIEVLERTVP